ncbi:hypothetical protein GJW-30_1_01467 [Variibacter gotjawalensis]|uniref:Uncharacterized protein n=1 Tax=Variibacter gotjawalensis TaxID=1333996 RepID=A0A0S3PSN6_9BRAD|nr:hypothetical protein [Variibacter gotjawalensis]NIK49252.1 hypothetical protein [Variibacter gotjawalensis]RZS51104.1 hypothetical protein EV661_3578 [Variibacter gotjawalensis]BAT58939.1 hypothetical protein GJW-30_1_01467 [Variibacter gotjawalensis]
MFQLSPQTIFSPRFLALPLIALTIIVALAQTASRNPTVAGAQVASPTVHRAINCSDPSKAASPTCTVAAAPARTVQ